MNKLAFWLSLGIVALALFLMVPDVAFAQASACPTGAPPPPANLAQALNEDCSVTWSAWVFSIWRLMMTVVNVFVVLFIIFIALATILHWNIDTYGFKKALPTLIIAVVLANFSLLIVRGMVDLASILVLAFAGDTATLARGIVAAIFGGTLSPISGIIGYDIVQWLFIAPALGLGILLMVLGAILVVLIPAIGFLILWFLLLIRLSVVLVFAAVSPLAFMALALPGTRPWFQRWFGIMLNWVFMAPVVFLLLRIGSEAGALAASGANTGPGFVNTMIPFLIALGALFMAIMAPFKMGGAIAAAGGAFMGFVAGTRAGGYTRTMFESAQKAGQAKKAELYLRTPLGKLQTKLDLQTNLAEERLRGRQSQTKTEVLGESEDLARNLTRATEQADYLEDELKRVQSDLKRTLYLSNDDFFRARKATKRLIKVADDVVEKAGEDIDKAAYVRSLADVQRRLATVAPGTPEHRRLNLEARRYRRYFDDAVKEEARGTAEDSTPEQQLRNWNTILAGGTLAGGATTDRASFGDVENVQVSADDLRNFARKQYDQLGATPADVDGAAIKSAAIEQKLQTLREWIKKGETDPNYEEGVEMGTEFARLVLQSDINPRTHAPWVLRANEQILRDPNTTPEQRRQIIRQASRELQALDFGEAGQANARTLGMATRPASHIP